MLLSFLLHQTMILLRKATAVKTYLQTVPFRDRKWARYKLKNGYEHLDLADLANLNQTNLNDLNQLHHDTMNTLNDVPDCITYDEIFQHMDEMISDLMLLANVDHERWEVRAKFWNNNHTEDSVYKKLSGKQPLLKGGVMMYKFIKQNSLMIFICSSFWKIGNRIHTYHFIEEFGINIKLNKSVSYCNMPSLVTQSDLSRQRYVVMQHHWMHDDWKHKGGRMCRGQILQFVTLRWTCFPNRSCYPSIIPMEELMHYTSRCSNILQLDNMLLNNKPDLRSTTHWIVVRPIYAHQAD